MQISCVKASCRMLARFLLQRATDLGVACNTKVVRASERSGSLPKLNGSVCA